MCRETKMYRVSSEAHMCGTVAKWCAIYGNRGVASVIFVSKFHFAKFNILYVNIYTYIWLYRGRCINWIYIHTYVYNAV